VGIGTSTAHIVDWIIIAIYLSGMVYVGAVWSKRIDDFEDYMLAGRMMTLPLLVGTLMASYFGGVYMYADAGFFYAEGLIAQIAYYPPYDFAAIFLVFFLVARLRILGDLTLPDVLGRFYGNVARFFAALSSIFYCLPIPHLMALGVTFDVWLGWPMWLGALVGGLVVLAYTLMGGLWAVAVTDMVQFTVMWLGMIVALPIALYKMGGWSHILAMNPEWHLDPSGGSLSWVIMAVYATMGLTVMVEPVFYQRFFAARDHKTAVRGFVALITIWILIDKVLMAFGLVGWAAFPGFQIKQDYALITTVLTFLPYGLQGLFLAGALAAIMSTIDSYLLVSAANLSHDIVRKIFRPTMSDKSVLKLTKWCLVGMFVVSFSMMFVFPRILLVEVLKCAVLTSVCLIPILGAFFWPFRKSMVGGAMAALVGFVSACVYIFLVFAKGSLLEGWDTYIWTVQVFGVEVNLWAEMAIYFSFPLALLAYLIGNMFGKPIDTKALAQRKEVAS
jgi:SSS family solute:Na+ symporter